LHAVSACVILAATNLFVQDFAMGWFVIAVLAGFLLYWAWSVFVPKNNRKVQALVGAAGVAAFLVALILWATLIERHYTARYVASTIGHGQVARFLLGAVLGAGCAHFMLQKLVAGQPVLWAALGITLVAIVAPNLDNWLSRVVGFKSSVVEIQLASNANHKVVVTEKIEAYANVTVFAWLSTYNDRIGQDIEYVRDVELNGSKGGQKKGPPVPPTAEAKKLEAFVASAGALKPVFDDLISPLVGCMDRHIKEGLSLERLREVVKPAARTSRN
jgi:hypothetical protein